MALAAQHLETSPMSDTQPVMARQHATTSVPTARAEQTVGEMREELTGGSFDYAGVVAVLDGDTLAAFCRSSACWPPSRENASRT